jgi:hypothetical protein
MWGWGVGGWGHMWQSYMSHPPCGLTMRKNCFQLEKKKVTTFMYGIVVGWEPYQFSGARAVFGLGSYIEGTWHDVSLLLYLYIYYVHVCVFISASWRPLKYGTLFGSIRKLRCFYTSALYFFLSNVDLASFFQICDVSRLFFFKSKSG